MIRNAGNGKLWIGIVQPDELERFVVVICVAGNDMFLVVLDKQGKELVKMAEQGALLCCAIEVECGDGMHFSDQYIGFRVVDHRIVIIKSAEMEKLTRFRPVKAYPVISPWRQRVCDISDRFVGADQKRVACPDRISAGLISKSTSAGSDIVDNVVVIYVGTAFEIRRTVFFMAALIDGQGVRKREMTGVIIVFDIPFILPGRDIFKVITVPFSHRPSSCCGSWQLPNCFMKTL